MKSANYLGLLCLLMHGLATAQDLDGGACERKSIPTPIKLYIDSVNKLADKFELDANPLRAKDIDPAGLIGGSWYGELYFKMLRAEGEFYAAGKTEYSSWPPEIQLMWRSIDADKIREHTPAMQWKSGAVPDKIASAPDSDIRKCLEKRRSFVPSSVPKGWAYGDERPQ